MNCPRCGVKKCVKNGKIREKQRFLCKSCNYRFIEDAPIISPDLKRHAIILYLEGMSLRDMARTLNISHTAILYWILPVKEHLNEMRSGKRVQKKTIAEILDYVKLKLSIRNYPLILIDLETGYSAIVNSNKKIPEKKET